MRPGARILPGALLLVMAYVVAGELLQGWVGLHFDAWRERPAFGGERDRLEWQRVERGLGVAQSAWPWKISLYRDAARLQLYGAYGGFVGAADAGAAVLDAVDHVAARRAPDGDLLALEVRGCLLYGDYAGAADAVARLKRVAPHARHYWQPLVRMLTALAKHDPDARALALDVQTHYAGWR